MLSFSSSSEFPSDFVDEQSRSVAWLDGTRINLLVGPNNAGKSRLLRWFIASQEPSSHQRVTKHYIPVLRTAWDPAYEVIHNQASNLNPHDGPFERLVRILYPALHHTPISAGTNLYESVRSAQDSDDTDKQDRLRKFEEFLRAQFFPQRSSLRIVPVKGKKSVAIRLDREQRDAHSLGDGILQLAIILLPAFTAEHGSWVCIEEPENSLHPGFQSLLMRTLATHPALSHVKFVLTTHSNHFLGAALDFREQVSVFHVRRIEERSCVTRVIGPNVNLLDDLGVSCSSVYLAKCSIWVEGPTDRIYLQAYLDALWAKRRAGQPAFSAPRENIDYVFIQYGGALIKHLDFSDGDDEAEGIKAKFVSNRVFLLADKDQGKEAHHEVLTLGQTNRRTSSLRQPKAQRLRTSWAKSCYLDSCATVPSLSYRPRPKMSPTIVCRSVWATT